MRLKIKFPKTSKAFKVAFLTSLITAVVILAVAGILLYVSRGKIFEAFVPAAEEGPLAVVGANGTKTGPLSLPEGEMGEAQKGREQVVITRESQIVSVVQGANPAVVSIVITKDVPIVEQYFEEFDPFEQFFGPDSFGLPGDGFQFQIPRFREKGTEKREVGGGSGFFVSSDGMVVTNKHVVADPDASYTVLTNDGKKFDAEVLAKDPFLDIAVLKVSLRGESISYLSFGDSDQVKLGQTAIAIGNALGEFRNSVSVGVVSGLSRSIVASAGFGQSELLEEVIQTDAAINPGNSGGPLLDSSGRVIGVNVAMVLGSENIGFALPSNTVKSVVDSVRIHGQIIRPYVGIRYMQITKSLAEKNNLPVDYGVLVVRGDDPEELAVVPGSPADKAGIVENDIILEADGQKLDGDPSFGLIVRKKNVGDTLRLKILSKGTEREITVTLEKAPQ